MAGARDRILANGKFEGDLFAFEATLAERVARESALYWI